jgi:hypothetical protein
MFSENNRGGSNFLLTENVEKLEPSRFSSPFLAIMAQQLEATNLHE